MSDTELELSLSPVKRSQASQGRRAGETRDSWLEEENQQPRPGGIITNNIYFLIGDRHQRCIISSFPLLEVTHSASEGAPLAECEWR